MILQALVDYYDALAKKGEICQAGWTKANVSFALNISQSGELLNVIPLKEKGKRGKKEVEVPQQLKVPEQVKKSSGITSNFLCENSGYFLGFDEKGKPERTKQCFECSAKLHTDILSECSSPIAEGIINYFKTWEPLDARNNSLLIPYLEEFNGANFIFLLKGVYAQDDIDIQAYWQQYREKNSQGVKMQCLVTGKNSVIARLHPAIKGVKGAQSSGASLVSFNALAYESYGYNDAQGLNAPVSEYAAFAYGTVLNHLLADRQHKQLLGDTTVVYWVESAEPQYQDFFNIVAFGDGYEIRDADLNSIFGNIAQGKTVDWEQVKLQPDNNFYILGLSPNAARVSVRFFLQGTYGEIIRHLHEHYERLEISRPSWDEVRYLSVWRLLQATVNKKAQDSASSPLLSGAVMRAILTGGKYPIGLLQGVMLRIRAEQDDSEKGIYKITRDRAAIIKAILIRNYNEKEVTTVAVNEGSRDVAYVLGRLFSVLEAVQQKANPDLNMTIKDKYFNSACATPAGIFTILLKLTNHHLRKLDKKFAVYFEKQITELQDKIDMSEHPLPVHMGLEDQGKFILGYYHQTQKRYTKKEDKDNDGND